LQWTRAEVKHRGFNRAYGVPTISLRDAYLQDTLADNSYVDELFIRKGEPGDYEHMDLRHVRRASPRHTQVSLC
jgi:hypothetical protein